MIKKNCTIEAYVIGQKERKLGHTIYIAKKATAKPTKKG
jgi:hypothetical protein